MVSDQERRQAWRSLRWAAMGVVVLVTACGAATPAPTVSQATPISPATAAPATATGQPPAVAATTTAEPVTATPEPATAVPTADPATPASTSAATNAAPHPNWIEVWDEKYGYGVALPCWWVVSPTPQQGMHGAMVVTSYDEAFVKKNTVRGEWAGGEFPPGAVKIDFIGWEGIDPNMSTADAVRKQLANEEQSVKNVEERTVNGRTVVVADLRNAREPDQPFFTWVYRLTPDTMLLASVYPNRAVESTDVQGILNSLAPAKQDKINVPTYAPGQPIIDVPSGCRKLGE